MQKKKIISIIIFAVMCVFLLSACSGTSVMYNTISDLSKAVNFDVANPNYVPAGYTFEGYFAKGSNIAEIVYLKGNDQLIFVMTTSKKVESDLGPFEETKDVAAGNATFSMNLSGGLVHLAVAQDGTYIYAIYSKVGLPEEETTHMAQSLNIGGNS